MGLFFTPKLIWHAAHLTLTSQALRSLLATRSYQKTFGYLPIFESFKTFDSMVKPFLCYASQIWGFEYVDISNLFILKFVEILYMSANQVIRAWSSEIVDVYLCM